MPRVEKNANYVMSILRIAAEWEFGHLALLFSFVKYRQGQKTLLSRFSQFYVAALLMKNIHICINSSKKLQALGNHDGVFSLIRVYYRNDEPYFAENEVYQNSARFLAVVGFQLNIVFSLVDLLLNLKTDKALKSGLPQILLKQKGTRICVRDG